MRRIKLFDYQQDMLDSIVGALTADGADSVVYDDDGHGVELGRSVMVQMPTGTGKTYVMAAVVRWFVASHADGEVWLVAHRRELVEQMQHTLDGFDIAYADKAAVPRPKVRVRVLSIQWLARHAGDMEVKGFKPGLIVVDEAHHALADSYQDVFARNAAALKMGMTATPCRMKKASFGLLFGRLLTSPTTADFIMRGFLAPYNYVVIGKSSVDQHIVNLLKCRGSDGDYAVREMDEKLNIPQAIQRLYNSVAKYASGRKGIVYAIDIAHAKAIAQCYQALGIKAVALDSKTPSAERRRMVEAFRCGEVSCLVNVNLFDEGFDCPDVEYIQMARPTLSLAKYLQMVGRGLRVNRENADKVCMIIDNVGNYRKFGYPDRPRDWPSMFAGLKAGKGVAPPYARKMSGMVAVDEDMVMVRKAAPERTRMTASQLESFKNSVVPFLSEDERLMGLRANDEIVLRPIYPYISAFNGNYAIFRLNNNNYYYGVIDRLGYIIITPEYTNIEFLNSHAVKAWRTKSDIKTITL